MSKQSSSTDSGLEKAINDLLAAMSTQDKDSDAYSTMVDDLDTLYKLKEIDKPERISRDTIAIIAGNLVGIMLIVGYERANVVTSKALAFLSKTR